MDSIRYIRSEEDVMKLSDECTALGKDIILDNIKSEVDVSIMMRYGLFPTNNFSVYNIDRLTMDEKSFRFWHPRRNRLEIIDQKFQHSTTWYYNTIENHKQNGIQKAISFPLIHIAPHLVYKKSKRPKTDMNIFRSPVSITMDKDNIINGQININGDIWNVIPVTRYSQGMSKGLYYNEKNETNYCGTFYYYEEESTTYLAYKTSGTYFNKTDALIKLGKEFNEDRIDRLQPILRMHMNGILPENLMMTPLEYAQFQLQKYGIPKDKYTRDLLNESGTLPAIPYYVGDKFNLYAAEDDIDQDLCEAAKEHNIDVIILTHMVGSHQVVTEVLDSRTRIDSFRSLIYTNNI